MSAWVDSVVGKFYHASFDDKIHKVTSHEPGLGFWIEDTTDPTNRRNVSERAIDRTLHERIHFPAEDRWVTRSVARAKGLIQ